MATLLRMPPMSTVEKPASNSGWKANRSTLRRLAEVAARVAVGPGRLQEQLLQGDSAAEPLLGRLQGRLVEEVLHPVELGGDHAGRLQQAAVDGIAVVGVDGRGLGAAFPQHSQFRADGVPAVADGLGLDRGEFPVADLADRRDAVGLGQGRRANLGGGLVRLDVVFLHDGRGLDRRLDGLGGLGGKVLGLAVVILVHCRNLLSKIGCPGRHACAGPAVGPQVHKTDLTQGRPPNDVQRPGKLPAVDHHPLVLLDELVLLDAGPKRRLPGETVAGRGHHFLRRHRVARNDAGRHQLAVLDPNRIGVSHAALHVVAEADRPALRGDRQGRPRSTTTGQRQPPTRIGEPV